MSEAFQESTKSLFRPHQVEQSKEEIKRLENTLNAPPHIAAQIQDRGEMTRQLRSLRHDMETQAPKPYLGELDVATKRSVQLRDEIIVGMPTHAEMRRNPVGATDKNRKWEKRNKAKILEWKNIQLRLHAGGHLDELEDSKDVANFERHRPTDASHELNMHGEQIPGKLQFGPTPGAEPVTVFSDDDKALLQSIDPEIAKSLALLNNDDRAKVKEIIATMAAPITPPPMEHTTGFAEVGGAAASEPVVVDKRRTWTPERKAAASAKAKANWAARKKEG